MKTIYDALIAEIHQNPDDDTPRLICADWLEEHGGQPRRAELIRRHMAFYAQNDDPDPLDLEMWTDAILDEFGPQCASPVCGSGVRRVVFDRGFVDDVECTASAFIRRGATWVAATPLRLITLRAVAGKGGQLAACPHLEYIRSLSITDRNVTNEDLAALARSHYAVKLDFLSIGGGFDVCGTRVGDAGFIALTTSPYFAALRYLCVESNRSLGNASVEALTKVADEDRLRTLHLDKTAIDRRGAMALGRATCLRNLTDFGISGGRLGSEGVMAVLRLPQMGGLHRAYFSANRVTGDVIHALAEADLPPELSSLSLDNNPLGDIDIDAVVDLHRRYPNLCLGLSRCNIPVGTQQELVQLSAENFGLDHWLL